jgi:U3 small nucleolar RNA-associated protein 11
MTNLKNFIPRRKYRERGQLKRREHLGLLEKKKDYKVRAKDYQAKMGQLR